MAAVFESFDPTVSRRRSGVLRRMDLLAPARRLALTQASPGVAPDDPMHAAIDDWLGIASGTNPAATASSPSAGVDARQDP